MSEFKYTPKNSVPAYWVKKAVSMRDWKNIYSPRNSYCNLGTIDEGQGRKVWIGFIVANKIPYDCIKLNDEELRQTDEFCRARNIKPFPLDEISIEKKVEENKIEENPEFPPDFVLPQMEF